MNYRIKLKIKYVYNDGYPHQSGVPADEVFDFVDFDKEKITITEKNEHNRKMISVSGDIEINGSDYEKFILDNGQFMYDITAELYKQNTKYLDFADIILSKKNVHGKRATFKIGNVNNKYYKILKRFSEKINIRSVTTHDLIYSDFRIYDTVVTKGVVIPVGGNVDAGIIQYIKDQNEGSLYDKITKIEITSCGGLFVSADVTKKKICAYGTGNMSFPDAIPPAGVGWAYDVNVPIGATSFPRFKKAPYTTDNITTSGSVMCATGHQYYDVEHEFIGITTYTDVARTYKDTLEYLISVIDSSVQFDASSFLEIDNFEMLADTITGDTHSFKNMSFIGIPDFMTTNLGLQKNVHQEDVLISLENILNYYEQYGFYWYLEDIAGTFYFRLKLHILENFASGNPNLKNYMGRDWSIFGKDYEIKEPEYWRIKNGITKGSCEFYLDIYKTDKAEVIFVDNLETKPKTFIDNDIVADIDYVMDAKTEKFEEDDTGKFVVFCLNDDNTVREVDSNNYQLAKNNLDLSALMLIAYTVVGYPAPSNYSKLYAYGTFRRNQIPQLEKRQLFKLEIPNKFNLDFDKNIELYGKEFIIQQIKFNLASEFLELTLKI